MTARKFLILFLLGIVAAKSSAIGVPSTLDQNNIPVHMNFSDMDAVNFNNSRIYNGYITSRYNFMVAIMIIGNNGNGIFQCGGTLISNRWVLTAGHCIPDLANAIQNGRAECWIGAYNIDISEGSKITQKIVIQRAVEPNPRHSKQTQLHDIALLELQSVVNWGNNDFGTICIGRRNYDNYNNIYLIGWGNHDCFQRPSKLNGAKGYTLRNNDVCRRIYGNIIQDSMICASLRGYQGDYAEQAPGDSGGPIFYTNAQTGNIVQIGIVSFNKAPDGCPDRNYPGVYTRVAEYTNWMNSVTGGSFSICD